MSPKRELERAVFWDRDLNKEKLIKPDNYVDEELFLKLLVVNPGFKKAAYLDLVLDSLVVNQQISLVVSLFLLHFSGSAWVGFIVAPFLLYSTTFPLSEALICAVLLLVLTPILMTLTDTYDTDTVYALVAGCALIHLYTYDYKYANTAFLMALLLASRMSNTYQAFAFLLTSVFLLIFLPPVLHKLRKSSQLSLMCVNLAVLAALQYKLAQVSSSLCMLHLTSVGLVTFIVPFALYRMQGHKRILSGPWEILEIPREDD